jgi:hypothetical protein
VLTHSDLRIIKTEVVAILDAIKLVKSRPYDATFYITLRGIIETSCFALVMADNVHVKWMLRSVVNERETFLWGAFIASIQDDARNLYRDVLYAQMAAR